MTAWAVLRTPSGPVRFRVNESARDDEPVLVREDNVTTTDETKPEEKSPTCHAGMDGDCFWKECPQNRDNEPAKTGRSCPLPHWTEDEDY